MNPRLRALQAPAAVVGCWLLLDQLFTVVAGHEGLLAPFGPVHLEAACLGLVVIALRLVVTFGVLPWAAWRFCGAPCRSGWTRSERGGKYD